LFLRIEVLVSNPLVPVNLFRRPDLPIACDICLVWLFTSAGWFLITGLYLQTVLRFSPEQVAVAFLPGNLVAAVVSLAFSARLVVRLGGNKILTAGLLVSAAAHSLFACVPVSASHWTDILPAMVLAGVGGGLTCGPMLLAATRDATPTESGLISGV